MFCRKKAQKCLTIQISWERGRKQGSDCAPDNSWRPEHRWVKDIVEQMVKISEQDNPKGAAQLVPVLFSGGELSPTPLVCKVTKFEDLMDIKGKEIKDKKVHGKILFAVPIVMLNVITLVFQGVKGFIFDFPASTAGSHQHNDIVPVNGNVRNPAIMIGCLFPVYNPILEKIDLPGVLCAIKRDVIHPVILVAFPFFIDYFEMTFAAHTGELFDPLEENLVVGRLCREDKGHAIVLQRIDKRLF